MAVFASRQDQAKLLVALVGLAVAAALLPFASGLLGIPVLYVLCAPAHRRAAARLGSRPAAVLVLLAALALILVPAGVLLGLVLAEAPQTLAGLQQSETFARLAALRPGGIAVGEQLTRAGGELLGWVSSGALAFLGSATHAALNLAITFFGVYYLLVGAGGLWAQARPLVPFSPARADALRDRFHSVTEATVLGIVLTSIAQGALVAAGFALVGLPSPLFWGAVAGLASLLPVVGSALIWGPAALALALGGRPGAAALLALIGFANSNLDNLIRLVVYRRVSDVHPMITLVGAFAGLRYFGLLGVLIGPLAIAYFFELLRMYREDYLPVEPAPATVQIGAVVPAAAPAD